MTTETNTTKRWPAQDAKAHFSELLEASLSEGPQIVTRRGVEADIPLPDRQVWRRRTSTALE